MAGSTSPSPRSSTSSSASCARSWPPPAAMGTARLIQKLFRRDQIGGGETLRKAVVDGLKAGDGIGGSALFAQQPGKARRGAQLAGQRLLLPRPIQRLPEEVLRRLRDSR